MKKYPKFFIVILTIVFASFTGNIKAQLIDMEYPGFHMGLRGGATLSTVTGNDSYAFPYGGIGMDFKVTPSLPIYIETGLYYMNKGYTATTGRKGDIDEDNHSVLLPLLASYHFYITDKMSVQPFVGPFVSYGFGLEDVDYGVRVGCGWNFRRLYLNFGYDFGLRNIEYGSGRYFETGKSGTFFATVGFNWAGSR